MAKATKTPAAQEPTWKQVGEGLDLYFESPESSNIRGASYKPETSELMVMFHGGRTYRYLDVPRNVWEQFATAESKGHYFATHLKDIYAGTRTV